MPQHSDQTELHDLAKSVLGIQVLVGNIRQMHAIGKCSKKLLKIISRMEKDEEFDFNRQSNANEHLIDNMLIVDRDIDFVATLISQLNYEGLLDETFGIEVCKFLYAHRNHFFASFLLILFFVTFNFLSCSGKLIVPKEITEKERLKANSKLTMQSSDPVFRDIRDMHLSTAFGELKRKGQHLKAKQKEREDMSLSAMREFVSTELKVIQNQQKSLSIHISLCEILLQKKNENDFVGQLNLERNLIEGSDLRDSISYIEQWIVCQHCPYTALRLLCLYSIMQNGILSKDYRQLTDFFLQSYGHEHIVTLFHLRKLGLLSENSSSGSGLPLMSGAGINSTFAAAISAFPKSSQLRNLIRRFNLVPPEGQQTNLLNPTDASFVFGGNYIPLVYRLVEYLFISRPANVEELLKMLNAPMHSRISTHEERTAESKKIIFIFFVGGVTYAEVSALRYLSKTSGYKILIGSTGTVNGSQLMKSLTAN
jgi:hypothetical protein